MEIKRKIEAANDIAVQRIISAEPWLVDIRPAGEVIPGLEDRMVLHSGPPVTWETISGAQKGAAIGMALFEGWARDAAQARSLFEKGAIRLEPNHHHDAVGPMAGTITKSLPVFVVENRQSGNIAYSRQAEGRQQFGEYSDGALEGLRLWRDVWAPSLGQGLRHMGGLALKPIIGRALHMGDELHNRPNAASALFALALAASMVDAGVDSKLLANTLRFAAANDFLFLGISMAAAKAATDSASGVEYSTIVTAMSRNGTEFGIRVSGLFDEWFTAPAPHVEGLFIPGYSDEDAGSDIGDSAISEAVGLGGFVLGGAPGILALVGGTPDEALAYTREMRKITVAESPDYRIPALGFEGAPVGIDIRKVVQTGILPVIDTAIAHKDPGYPNIGAGIVRPPIVCFKRALQRFAEKCGVA